MPMVLHRLLNYKIVSYMTLGIHTLDCITLAFLHCTVKMMQKAHTVKPETLASGNFDEFDESE